LNGKWYLCDATWSSGYLDEKDSFIKVYNDGYFLTDPILFGKSHLPTDSNWSLIKNLNADTFITSPLVYAETYEHGINPISPKTM
jgi:transglutaminase/protease-like cytokinesis protein 3